MEADGGMWLNARLQGTNGERSHPDVDGRWCMRTMMRSSLALLTVEFVDYACVIVLDMAPSLLCAV